MPTATDLELLLDDETATAVLAAALAGCVGPGFLLYLSGDLGAGKTAFTRALLRALGHTGRVRSPTFTLSESYNLLNFTLYHFDFYRFSANDEWRDLGFDELLGGSSAAVVEWPELGGGTLPEPDVGLRLDAPDEASGLDPEHHRIARLRAGSDRGRQCLTHLLCSIDGGLVGVSSRAVSADLRSR